MRASITAWVFRAALALAVTAVGCGGDGNSANSKDDFIAQFCDQFKPCCQAAGRPSDGAQCRAIYGALTPNSGFDSASGDACLDEFRAAGDKKCDLSSLDTPSCDKAFARHHQAGRSLRRRSRVRSLRRWHGGVRARVHQRCQSCAVPGAHGGQGR
ncbi:MAG TPA: hypothetical protein VHB79_33285 [Polyangiaceae bacterium]|nr:hypothetical protein [Polyangiaceae bacterium]